MANLTFQNFVEEVRSQITDFLPEEYEGATVEVVAVTKNNGTELTGLNIRKPGCNISPNIYLNDYYNDYISGRMLESILLQIARLRIDTDVAESFDTNIISSFEKVTDYIYPKLVNYELNKDRLTEIPYISFAGDLALLFYINASEFTKDLLVQSGAATINITNQLLDNWGITVQDLKEVALRNQRSSICFKTMREILAEMDPAYANILPEEDDPTMYVLSNNNKINGAAAITDTDFLEGIKNELDSDLVILPSSIHEVIIIPKRKVDGVNDPETLKEMIGEVNGSELQPDEILSDRPYIYSGTKVEAFEAVA